jgi:hypothetical protein
MLGVNARPSGSLIWPQGGANLARLGANGFGDQVPERSVIIGIVS